MTVNIDLRFTSSKEHYDLPITVQGDDVDPQGKRIAINDYFINMDGEPWYGVCGEFHYSRVKADRWDEELAKMAMNGINIVSTYVFWNHHEEHEGHWIFSGNRNLREFVRLCARNHLYVIVRLGPFAHGEARNGGLPDWLYGKPYEVRSLDPGFLAAVRDLYNHEAEQLRGLYYADGGPIIAAQLDNEYMHSAAPWELTTGVSNEWVPGGHDGEAYLQALRTMATQAGIRVPFFTSTGWGGSPVPPDVLPLWGGYAYRPWLFYAHGGEHPKTDEYLYRNYHADDCKQTEEFDPSYSPSSLPYACCEMGGGMFSSYHYRFQLPMKSVDAMANIKLGSGCNMLGYYMFHGGTNPQGDGVYLNESQTPKRSYDFQAAIGQYGQVRESCKRLKTIHSLVQDFSEQITPLEVYLPSGQDCIDPADSVSLRWSLRTDGLRGFVFLNNFQDHAELGRQKNRSISLTLADGRRLTIDGIGLENQENCILPFNMDLDGITLVCATVQPVARLQPRGGNRPTFVFMKPDGMSRYYMRFQGGTVMSEEIDADIQRQLITVTSGDRSINVVVVDRDQSNAMYVVDHDSLVFVDDDSTLFMSSSGSAVLESSSDHPVIEVWPPFSAVLSSEPVALPHQEVRVDKAGTMKYILHLPSLAINVIGHHGVTDMLLRIRYSGDIAWLWAGSTLLDDNFANGSIWEVGLRDYRRELLDNDNALVLGLTPLKKGSFVNVDSAMAARTEQVEQSVGRLISVELTPIYAYKLQIS